MTVRLPLFPLGTVLFPGLVLPLHIFEERYQTLVRDLLGQPRVPPPRFGVVTIKAGQEVGADGVRALYDVGCTAELHKVEAYSDGRFDLVTTGRERFLVRAVTPAQPYLYGDVEFLPEEQGEHADRLSIEVTARFGTYQRRLRGLQGEAPLPPPDLPPDPVVLSYLVAATTILDMTDKQRLLEATDAAVRLRLECDLLRRENSVLGRLPSLPAVDLLRQAVTSN